MADIIPLGKMLCDVAKKTVVHLADVVLNRSSFLKIGDKKLSGGNPRVVFCPLWRLNRFYQCCESV